MRLAKNLFFVNKTNQAHLSRAIYGITVGLWNTTYKYISVYVYICSLCTQDLLGKLKEAQLKLQNIGKC